MDSAKENLLQARDRKLKQLRLQLGQSRAWDTQVLELLEDLAHDNLRLRRAYSEIKRQVDQLSQEKMTV
jgi:hypothetical protein